MPTNSSKSKIFQKPEKYLKLKKPIPRVGTPLDKTPTNLTNSNLIKSAQIADSTVKDILKESTISQANNKSNPQS